MIYIQRTTQAYQYGLNGFTHIVSNTNSLGKILRISSKTIKFYSKMKSSSGEKISLGLSNLSLQIRGNLEILTVIQSITLIQELTCPNKNGFYLFSRASWQKSASKVFLLFYYTLSNIKLAEKLKFIDLGKISKVAIEHMPIFRLVTSALCTLSYICAVGEGVRTKGWFKVATSVGKIFVLTLALLLEALNSQRLAYVLLTTGISCIIDIVCLAKNVGAL